MRTFKMLMPRTAGIVALVTLAAVLAPARAAAEPADRWIRAGALERGCYFMRGRQICARYCYIEADGHRYCRERQRDAVSQAPFLALEGDPFGPPVIPVK